MLHFPNFSTSRYFKGSNGVLWSKWLSIKISCGSKYSVWNYCNSQLATVQFRPRHTCSKKELRLNLISHVFEKSICRNKLANGIQSTLTETKLQSKHSESSLHWSRQIIHLPRLGYVLGKNLMEARLHLPWQGYVIRKKQSNWIQSTFTLAWLYDNKKNLMESSLHDILAGICVEKKKSC